MAPSSSRHGSCGQKDVGAFDALLSVLLAPTCAACGAVLDTPMFSAVCKNCWRTIPPIAQPVLGTPGVITVSGAAGEYDGSLRAIIHAFKYDKRRSLAFGLAVLMGDRAGEILQGADCSIPVPLHPRRERARGFNQAREIARRLELPVVEALVRSRHTPSQVDLEAEQRHANVQGAFSLRRRWFRAPLTLEGRTVVLVDDVSTTGATLEACAAVLQDAGAREIRALTAARVSGKTLTCMHQ